LDHLLGFGYGTQVRIFGLLAEAECFLLEVAEIWVGRDDGRHRSNVKTKQRAANNGDGRDNVDVSHGIHVGERRGGNESTNTRGRGIQGPYMRKMKELEMWSCGDGVAYCTV
jgi:hypothetical protein